MPILLLFRFACVIIFKAVLRRSESYLRKICADSELSVSFRRCRGTDMTVKEYIETYSPAYRGHTPGHKGKADRRDITEILDIFPDGAIASSERAAAHLYDVPYLRFLVGGSSIGIKAAVLALGEDFVTDGYCHRAAEEAARLAGVNCFKLPAPADARTGLPELTSAESLINEMRSRGARNALVQYPDYYGRTPDLKKIYAAVRSYGGRLICDSAHGAHFFLRPDLFPISATQLSDVCNMSAHKTLGAMTQTAFLAAGGKIDREVLDEKLDDLGTTSPNYVLLASLETALGDGMNMRGEYDRLKRFSDEFRSEVPCLKNDDFTRIAVDFGNGNGRTAAYALYDIGIAAEKYDDRYVVFIITPYDTDDELGVLLNGVERIREGIK